MNISRNILADIQRRANKMEIPDAELYRSEQFARYFQDTANTILRGKTEPVIVSSIYDPASDLTGCTNGSFIQVNTASPLSTHFDAQEGRFLANLGLLAHECAHCIYLDFDGNMNALREMNAGRFWPKAPTAATKQQRDSLMDMVTSIQDERIRSIVIQIVSNLQNTVADAHDEACLCSDSGTLINNAITAMNMALRAESLSLDKMVDDGAEPLEIMFSLILQYILFYDIIVEKESTRHNEYAKRLEELIPILNGCRFSNSTEDRMEGINQILLILWPYVRKVLDDPAYQQNGQGNNSGNGSNGQQVSDSAIQQAMSQLGQAMQNAGQSVANAAPQNRTSSSSAGTGKPGNAPSGQQPGSGLPPAQDAAAQAMDALKREVAEQKAEAEVEQELSQQLRQRMENQAVSDLHAGTPFQVNRPLHVTADMRREYLDEYQRIQTYSIALQRKMKNLLRDLNDDGLVRRSYGPIMKPQEAYRRDKRFFFRRKLPADLPDMSIGILVDESGSMSGERLEACRRAAILLDDFATGLDIPVMVAGHHVMSSECELDVYVPFERASMKDRYRLMSMDAGGCNRDGLALGKMAQLMMDRTEDVRLLFIISDGRPSSGPTGETAFSELREICRKAEKRGVQVFAAGIGSDRDTLREIYGNRYLDVTDLSKLPVLLVNMVKRRLV